MMGSTFQKKTIHLTFNGYTVYVCDIPHRIGSITTLHFYLGVVNMKLMGPGRFDIANWEISNSS